MIKIFPEEDIVSVFYTIHKYINSFRSRYYCKECESEVIRSDDGIVLAPDVNGNDMQRCKTRWNCECKELVSLTDFELALTVSHSFAKYVRMTQDGCRLYENNNGWVDICEIIGGYRLEEIE
jgi:hypothetical protein